MTPRNLLKAKTIALKKRVETLEHLLTRVQVSTGRCPDLLMVDIGYAMSKRK